MNDGGNVDQSSQLGGVPQEFVLFEPPSDGISCARFSPTANDILLVSSWDSTVRLYNVSKNQLTLSTYTTVPVLHCCFSDAFSVYASCLDGIVKKYEIPSMKVTTIGSHEKAARYVEMCYELNTLVSGSWDKTCKMWDERSAQPPTVIQQQDKVYAMSINGNKLVVANAARKLFVWDLRYPTVPVSKKDSSAKYQIRSLACSPNGDGYALGTIEGRIYVELLEDDCQLDRYSFKCHRLTNKNNLECVYPVNAIAFHPEHNTFASGGSDGLVNIWDPYNKKRLCHLRRYPNSIVSLAINIEGTHLAIASSYQFEDKNKDMVPPDTIYIRRLKDTDVMQRP